MSFVNQPSILIADRSKNLINFTYKDEKIHYYFYDHYAGRVERRVVLQNATNDFDASIDDTGDVYLICKGRDNGIKLLSNHRNFNHITVLLESEFEIQNLRMIQIERDLHRFYCKKTFDSIDEYIIVHDFDDGQKHLIKEAGKFKKGDILNPIQCAKGKDSILLTYYDLVSNVEQLYLTSYNLVNKEWNEPIQLTHSNGKKYYQDVLLLNEELHSTYCEEIEGNFVVKYEKYLKNNDIYGGLLEYELSNPGNCNNPILIQHGHVLWVCWVEYNYIASRYSINQGESWSDIYQWNDSRMEDILKFKYISNKKETAILNYSFGSTKDMSFIGFGELRHTSKIPINKKGTKKVKGVNGDSMGIQENKEYGDEIGNVLKEMDQMNDLSNHTDEIENQLKGYDHGSDNLKEDFDHFKEMIDGKVTEIEERLLIIEKFLLQYTKKFSSFKEN